MHEILFWQRIDVAAVAAIFGVAYLVVALLRRRHGETSALGLFAVAASGFAIAALVALHYLAPVVAYSVLCFSGATVLLADMLQDEHARRRRVASLSPRPPADSVPIVWITIALTSTLLLVPYVLRGIAVAPALIVAGCAIGMAAIAWRIASAPTQLTGEDPAGDPRTEHIRDRALRARKAGLTCVVTIGSIGLFIRFVDETLPSGGGLGIATVRALLAVWAMLAIWVYWYAFRVAHSKRPLSE